jgi:putative flippase GtrA
MATYFGVLWFGESVMPISPENTKFHLVRIVAEILQWVLAVLFAFFTNKKWVFTDADKNVSTVKQLMVFAGGRVVTFFIDLFGTILIAIAAAKLIPALTSVTLIGREWNLAEIGAKIFVAVIVLVSNYVISKLLVFKKSKKNEN